MDNAKIYLGETIRELIEKAMQPGLGGFPHERLHQEAGAKLIYLSAYSPEFSLIENYRSKVKATINL